jgi:hypothetical protein
MELPLPVHRGIVPYIAGDHIYAVLVNELDVPYVVRFRIVRP